jgi:hypothetical protein
MEKTRNGSKASAQPMKIAREVVIQKCQSMSGARNARRHHTALPLIKRRKIVSQYSEIAKQQSYVMSKRE